MRLIGYLETSIGIEKMTATDGKIRIGLSMRYLGYHMAAWRHPDVPAAGAIDFNYFLRTAKKAEEAKLDMIFCRPPRT